MRDFIAFISLAACLLKATAGEIIIPANSPIAIYTNTIFSTNTSGTNIVSLAYTNIQDTRFCTFHTFHLFNTPTGTNLVTAALDRTVDGSNWFVVSSNGYATGGTNYEYTTTGKWLAYRWRMTQTSTNSLTTGLYMGQ